MAKPDIVTRVRACRLFLIIFVVGVASGCLSPNRNSDFTPNQPYFRLRVTDSEGKLIAEWIAQGTVVRKGDGYRFTAVQRLSGPRFSILSKYPLGRKVYIEGPNIVISHCGKPLWLYHLHMAGSVERIERTSMRGASGKEVIR